MAAGVLPKPGSKYGPCVFTTKDGISTACGHIDCATTRADAEQACPICSEPIGYEVRFYMDEKGRERPDGHRMLVHAKCLEDEVEARSA